MLSYSWEPGVTVLQYGKPRTASTFQYYLLCSIVAIKLGGGNFQRKFLADGDVPSTLLNTSSSSVFKTHKNPELVLRRARSAKTLLFYSASSHETLSRGLKDKVVYAQRYERMLDCPLGEIDFYAPIFNLTQDETRDLKEHMEYWAILRVCCGLQQSLDNRLRLHGCPPRRKFDDPAHPHCEFYDLTAVERRFANTSLSRRVPGYNLRPIGRCAEDESIIRKGTEFHREKFAPAPDACAHLVGIWAKYDAAAGYPATKPRASSSTGRALSEALLARRCRDHSDPRPGSGDDTTTKNVDKAAPS